jgi:glycosyltransferase involved in cell wall biosynthesis
MNRKRILLVGNFLCSRHGTRSVCEDLAERLATAGWSVLTTSHRLNRVQRLAGMLSTAWSKRCDYDMAHVDVFSGRAFLWAEAVCKILRLARRPYVLTLHGGNLPRFAGPRPRRVRYLLHSAAAVTAPSLFMAERMRPYRSDIHVVANGLDLSRTPFSPRHRPRPEIVWLRAFDRMYRPWVAVQALGEVLREFPQARMTMFGPDKGDGSLTRTHRAAQDAGVSGRLHVAGAVPRGEVPRRLAAADIFLNTTAVESFGVSVAEAAALGLCVVTTNAGALPSIWADEREVLMVPPDDSRAIAAAIKRILTEPHLSATLSQGGRRKAESFDWPAILPQWDRLLSSVARQGSA